MANRKEIVSNAEMLKYLGYDSMREFMVSFGLYTLIDAKRLLEEMYEEAVLEDG